jgi:hypothetical protein
MRVSGDNDQSKRILSAANRLVVIGDKEGVLACLGRGIVQGVRAILVVLGVDFDISGTARDLAGNIEATSGDTIAKSIATDYRELLSGTSDDDLVTISIELKTLPSEVVSGGLSVVHSDGKRGVLHTLTRNGGLKGVSASSLDVRV